MMRHLEVTDADPISLPTSFSREFREFIFACLKVNPKDRPAAKALLDFEFIKQHEETKPTLRRWIYDNYISKRKRN